MTHITCRLTAENRDQLRNPTLGNRLWATFTFLYSHDSDFLTIVLTLRRSVDTQTTLRTDSTRETGHTIYEVSVAPRRVGSERGVEDPEH